MARPRIVDEQWGPLEWYLFQWGWGTWIDHPVFQSDGAEILAQNREAGIEEETADPKRKAFELLIDAAKHEALPTADQRREWQFFLEHAPRIHQEILQQAFAMYRRQRAPRIHWWREIYGANDPLLPRVLPEIDSIDALRPLLRVKRFILHRDWLKYAVPQIGIHIDTAWDRRGFGVRLRQGKIVALGNEEVATKGLDDSGAIEHPVLGTLRFEDTWEGTCRWEPLREYHNIAEDRELNRKDRATGPFRGLLPRWNFLDGQFDLVIAGDDDGPSPEALALYQRFMADPDASARQVLQAILKSYQELRPSWIEQIRDPEFEQVMMPPIDTIEGLRPLLTFQTLRIFTSQNTDELSIGLGFHCSWEQEHGLGVRWRNGVVEEVAEAEVSFR